MHPSLIESVAAERVKDMRNEAVAAQRARLARRARRLRPAHASATARQHRPHLRGAAARHAG